jgi:hypothetical protein
MTRDAEWQAAGSSESEDPDIERRRPSQTHVRHGDFVPEGQLRDESLHMRFVTALRPGPLAMVMSASIILAWFASAIALDQSLFAGLAAGVLPGAAILVMKKRPGWFRRRRTRPGLLAILCILLVGCTPPGPSAELTLGWGHSIIGLAELEGIFVQHGFKPEMRESISSGSAGESVPAWRHRGEGTTFSYFSDGPADDYGLRAVLSLSDIAGRLRVIVFGRGACQHEAFNRDRQDQLAKLATAIGERFKRKVTFKYDPGGRC